MGNSECFKSNRRRREELELLIRNTSQQSNLPQPAIFNEEGFMLVDYTRQTFGMYAMSQLKQMVYNYLPVDVRCIREEGKSPSLRTRPHSYVEISAQKLKGHQVEDEIMITVEFTSDGFIIMLGDSKTLALAQNRQSARVEMVLFPEAEAKCSIGLHEIVEWAYNNKSIAYKPVSLEGPKEENVGKQLYHYIVERFSGV
mmetsp:Transcript_34225/g.59891  ORF Transcript_34225/g.59891 Transcript_34225/m.59891 type:complete len:199 (-) Transcript_34225:3882-4478(-)